ncbi:MAG TPA: hypothetical protein VGE27_01440 [Gemmatimonas sp.]|uniref:hypothetical protein n=1 Tax=Gemmatimonas sp. TaxID=1962908 RepID=UPI002ED844BF
MRRPRLLPRNTSALTIALASAMTIAALPATAHAQRLRDRISQLFIFGDGEEPLFLAGSATSSNPASVRAHGTHFIPSSQAENGSIIGFISSALAASVSNVPIGATTSGETFRFEGGVPVSTATSAGPIFAERGQTLGRGRVLTGVNRSTFKFSTLRGRPLSDVGLVFTHENVDYDGCDAEQGGQDCSKYGVPVLENESMSFNLDLNIAVDVTSFYTTFGITDRIDFGVVVPLQQTSFTGTSFAQISPFGGTSAAHFFSGTPTDPVLQATKTTKGNTFGIGDVAARLKVNAFQSQNTAIAFLADARFPTGDVEDLLGQGRFALRSQAIMSSRFGDFSPHVNAGFLYRADETQNHSVLATAGFDHLLGPKVTLAVDIVSEFQVGASKLVLPQPIFFDSPYRRSVNPTSIPDIRDDLINGSFGFKFLASRNVIVVTNALLPLNRGGMRANQLWTMGLEYSF